MKIRIKIFLLILGLMSLATLLFHMATSIGIKNILITNAENELLKSKETAQAYLRQNMETKNEEEFRQKADSFVVELEELLQVRVSIYDDSTLIADSNKNYHKTPLEVQQALKGDIAYRMTEDYMYFAFPVENLGAMRLVYSLQEINQTLHSIQELVTMIGFILFIVSILGANFLAKKISQPVIRLNEVVKKVQHGKYEVVSQIFSKDEIGELSLSFHNMTQEIQQKIEQLVKMVDREKSLKNLQRDFLNNVTHEFKTPLTSIIGYADLIEQYEDDLDLKNNGIKIIRSEGQRLYDMVEKLLYLSQVERYDIELEVKEFPIDKLVSESIAGVEIKANNKSIIIETNILYNGNIRADFDMLYRMLINLLDNAIKYNDPGGKITIHISQKDKNLHFIIKDTGWGICDEHLQQVFKPFYREDKTRSRKLGGDGLGLTIVKEIVFKHQGEIHLQSKKGKGTEVSIILPMMEVPLHALI